MNTAIRVFLGLILVLLICGNSFADYPDSTAVEYLIPETGITAHSSRDDYFIKVKKTFVIGYKRGTVFRMVCLPSFSPEWLVGVRKVGNEYSVFLLSAKEEILGYKDGEWKYSDEPAIEYSAVIDPDTVNLLTDLWKTMLLETRYPQLYMTGHDGTNYHFSMFIWGRGDISGKVWSPRDNTKPGTLSTIGELLSDYAKQNLISARRF